MSPCGCRRERRARRPSEKAAASCLRIFLEAERDKIRLLGQWQRGIVGQNTSRVGPPVKHVSRLVKCSSNLVKCSSNLVNFCHGFPGPSVKFRQRRQRVKSSRISGPLGDPEAPQATRHPPGRAGLCAFATFVQVLALEVPAAVDEPHGRGHLPHGRPSQ